MLYNAQYITHRKKVVVTEFGNFGDGEVLPELLHDFSRKTPKIAAIQI